MNIENSLLSFFIGKREFYFPIDHLKAVKGVLSLRVMDLQGNLITTRKANITLPANTSKIQLSERTEKLLGDKKANEVVVNVCFSPDKGAAVTNNYFLTRYKDIEFPKAVIKKQSVASANGYDVTIESDVFARGVFLSIEGIDNFFSDNYFDLLPGEPVKIHVATSLDKATFDKQLQSVCISDAY